MRGALDRDGLDERIREDHLVRGRRRGIALERGIHVRLQQLAHLRHAAEKVAHDFLRALVRAVRIAEPQALADFLAEPLRNGEDAVRSDARQVLRMDRLRIVKTRKQELEQFLANRGDRALGRQVRAVHMVDASAGLIRAEDSIGHFAEIVVHRP
jgi:hypothetical protein